MNLLVVNPFRRFGQLYFCESPSNCVFLWKSFTMTTFRIFAAWFAYKSLQVSADASFQHLEISLAGPHVTTIWWNKYNMEFSAFRSESSHHMCVSDYSASGKVLRQPPAGSLAHFSSHFARVPAFPHTLLEFELFLTPWSSSSFRLVFAFDWSSMMVVGVSTAKVFLLVVMLVMLVKPWYKGSSLICHNAFDVLEHWHHTTCPVYFPS